MALSGMLGGGGGKVGKGFVEVVPDAADFGTKLDNEIGNQSKGIGDKHGKAFSQAFAAAAAAGIGVAIKGVMDFAGFDKGMREVFTLMPDITAPAMDAMTQQVKDFSAEFGVLPTETVPALYSALSAGVPADNVFAFIETSQKLAKGGVTDLATAVDGLSSVVNAYGSDVLTAEQASDIMFTTVKLGKTTVAEMSDALFQVAPVAAAFGVSFEEIGASIATLTSQGVPTSVAATQIRGAISEMGKSGTVAAKAMEAATGSTFPEWIAAGNDMSSAMQMMQMHAEANGLSLVDMFGSIEAGQAALGITKDLVKTNQTIVAMGDSAGATEAAFETMNVGLSATMDKIKARMSVALINLGESLAPTILVVGEALAGVVDVLSKMPGPLSAAILGFGTLLAGLLAFAGPITKAITLGKQLSGVFTLLAGNPWLLAALAIVAVGVLIWKNWDTIVEKLTAAWSVLSAAASATATFFTNLWNTTTSAVMGFFDTLGQFFVDYWPYLLGIFTFGLGTIVGLVIQNWDTIWAKVSDVTGAIVGAVQGAWDTVYGITTGIGGAVVSFIVGIPNTVASAFTTLADIIVTPFKVAFTGIKTAWNNTVGGFGFDAPGWIPGVGGKGFHIPSMAAGAVVSFPTLAMVGDAGAGDPEIVAPQSMIRETVIDAIGEATTEGGDTFHLHLHVDAGITDKRFFEERAVDMVRAAQRELDRQRRAGGATTRGVAA